MIIRILCSSSQILSKKWLQELNAKLMFFHKKIAAEAIFLFIWLRRIFLTKISPKEK